MSLDRRRPFLSNSIKDSSILLGGVIGNQFLQNGLAHKAAIGHLGENAIVELLPVQRHLCPGWC